MHLGVIPDGNRRYAEQKGIEEKEAYRKARQVIEDIGEEIAEEYSEKVDELTLYLLSEDNLKRNEEDLEAVFGLMEEYIEEISENYSRNGFSFNWITTLPEALPEKLKKKLRSMEEQYDKGEKTLNILFSYSGKSDVLHASEKMSKDGDFTRENMRKKLSLGSEIDYVIRTGDNPTRECLSDFPIWEASYAEYYHIKRHFPALEMEDVRKAIENLEDMRRKKGQ